MSVMKKIIILLYLVNFCSVHGDNKPPYFLPGNGDFATFSIPENFQVGTSVYKLKGLQKQFINAT
jgi:hypothetical protein